jgi:hypothetical protein
MRQVAVLCADAQSRAMCWPRHQVNDNSKPAPDKTHIQQYSCPTSQHPGSGLSTSAMAACTRNASEMQCYGCRHTHDTSNNTPHIQSPIWSSASSCTSMLPTRLHVAACSVQEGRQPSHSTAGLYLSLAYTCTCTHASHEPPWLRHACAVPTAAGNVARACVHRQAQGIALALYAAQGQPAPGAPPAPHTC